MFRSNINKEWDISSLFHVLRYILLDNNEDVSIDTVELNNEGEKTDWHIAIHGYEKTTDASKEPLEFIIKMYSSGESSIMRRGFEPSSLWGAEHNEFNGQITTYKYTHKGVHYDHDIEYSYYAIVEILQFFISGDSEVDITNIEFNGDTYNNPKNVQIMIEGIEKCGEERSMMSFRIYPNLYAEKSNKGDDGEWKKREPATSHSRGIYNTKFNIHTDSIGYAIDRDVEPIKEYNLERVSSPRMAIPYSDSAKKNALYSINGPSEVYGTKEKMNITVVSKNSVDAKNNYTFQ